MARWLWSVLVLLLLVVPGATAAHAQTVLLWDIKLDITHGAVTNTKTVTLAIIRPGASGAYRFESADGIRDGDVLDISDPDDGTLDIRFSYIAFEATSPTNGCPVHFQDVRTINNDGLGLLSLTNVSLSTTNSLGCTNAPDNVRISMRVLFTDCEWKLGPSTIDGGTSMRIDHANHFDGRTYSFSSALSNYILSRQDTIVAQGNAATFLNRVGQRIRLIGAAFVNFVFLPTCGSIFAHSGDIEYRAEPTSPVFEIASPAGRTGIIPAAPPGNGGYDPPAAIGQLVQFTVSIGNSSGNSQTTTTVNTGTVTQIDQQGARTTLNSGDSSSINTPAPFLFAAILPASRSIQVPGIATAFATIVNAGAVGAVACRITPPAHPAPAGFNYQTTNPATNALTGTANTPVSIAPGASQSFVFALRTEQGFDPTDARLGFSCLNAGTVRPLVGINTMRMAGSTTPVPDVIAVGLTPSNDGIAHTGGPAGTGLFAVSTINIGAAGELTARARLSSPSIAAATFVCRTNANGTCLTNPAPTVTTQIASNEAMTWTVLIPASGTIALDPATNRVFFELVDASGVVRGSTSTAVSTQP